MRAHSNWLERLPLKAGSHALEQSNIAPTSQQIAMSPIVIAIRFRLIAQP